MRFRIAIGAVLVAAGAVLAFTVNPKGTSQAPITVSNSAITVMDAQTLRRSWCIYPETVDIRCTFGGTDGSAPSVTPTSSRGYLFPHAAQTCANSGFNSNYSGATDPQNRVDCISTGADTLTDVITSP